MISKLDIIKHIIEMQMIQHWNSMWGRSGLVVFEVNNFILLSLLIENWLDVNT